MIINESAENYLETILVLSGQLPVVRSVDIAAELDFKKPSVSVAMKKLRESGHITVSPEGYITLTPSGKGSVYTNDIPSLLPGWNISASIQKPPLMTPAVLNMSSARKALTQ